MNDDKPKKLPRPTVYDQLYPGRFLKAAELLGKKVTVTITDVELEELEGDMGERKAKAILSFKEAEKKMVLCKTNGICIREMFGRTLADWIGKRITLFEDTWNGEPATRIWGSPDLAEDMEVRIELPRRRPFSKTMRRVTRASQAAPAPAPAPDEIDADVTGPAPARRPPPAPTGISLETPAAMPPAASPRSPAAAPLAAVAPGTTADAFTNALNAAHAGAAPPAQARPAKAKGGNSQPKAPNDALQIAKFQEAQTFNEFDTIKKSVWALYAAVNMEVPIAVEAAAHERAEELMP